MSNAPSPTFSVGYLPDRSLGTLPTAAPSASNKLADILGTIPSNGWCSIEVDKACAIEVRVLCLDGSGNWKLPGASSNYGFTFADAAGGVFSFAGQPGAFFHVKSDQSSTSAWTNGPAVPANSVARRPANS